MKLAYPHDRVVDRTAEFASRHRLHQRYHSPRQRRLRCEKAATLAQYHELLASIGGGILLILLFIVLSFI